MVHQKDSALARKIWAGEYLGQDGALARGLAEYERTRKRTAWASTLYSALNRLAPEARAGELRAVLAVLWCLRELYPLARHWEHIATHHRRSIALLYTPDECDVIGSALLFWYRLPWASWLYASGAEAFAESAYERTKHDAGAHTPVLSALIVARIALLRLRHTHVHAARYRAKAEENLARARQHVAFIHDANQRSRAHRGIAEVTLGIRGYRHDAVLAARRELDLADAVQGIAPDVRAKNAEMRRRLKL